MTQANVDRDWENRYITGDLPWDSGRPSTELMKVLGEYAIAPCRALELGCGTGTNAVAMAELGFQVTAVDCAPTALERARQKAADAGVNVEWIEADVQNFGEGREPFEFAFDRGCYHCCRRVDLAGYQQTLRHVTRPGSRVLILAGNANEQSTEGPPRVTEDELRRELGADFKVLHLREFRFEDPGGAAGPLGWSVLLERNGPDGTA